MPLKRQITSSTTEPPADILQALDWFIGNGVDTATLVALQQLDYQQKALARSNSIAVQ